MLFVVLVVFFSIFFPVVLEPQILGRNLENDPDQGGFSATHSSAQGTSFGGFGDDGGREEKESGVGEDPGCSL